MAFEPFGRGERRYDRVGGRNLKPKEFALVLLVIGIISIAWQLFG